MKTDFVCTLNKGFRMTFENGLSISVQFGNGNYCDNRSFAYKDHKKDDFTTSATAEIAIIDENTGKWFNFGNDQVKGYVSPDEVAIWIHKVKTAKRLNTIKRIKQ